MTSARVRRFFTAFDWKLVWGLIVLALLLMFMWTYYNDQQTIASKSESQRANRVERVETRAILSDALTEVKALRAEGDHRAAVASRQRAKLERQIAALTQVLRANGITPPKAGAPASASSRPASSSSPSRPSAGSSSSSSSPSKPPSGGSSGGGSGGGSTPAPKPPTAPPPPPPIICALGICVG